MSLVTIYVDREGVSSEATYGNLYLEIPATSWQAIKNNKMLLSEQQRARYQKYQTSIGSGSVKFNDNSTLKDFCEEKPDGSSIFRCFTLEDLPRKVKIAKETCIPEGTYPTSLTKSPRFGYVCAALSNVPNFEGVRIHAGANKGWTEGCILVGFERTSNGSRLSSSATCDVVFLTLLLNLAKVGHKFQTVVRFTYTQDELEEVINKAQSGDIQTTISNLSTGFNLSTSGSNFTSVGPAGDCGCYSLSDFDPNTKGDYATQNTKTFFSKIANLVYDTVKNKVKVSSYTNGTATTGSTTTPIVQDATDYRWVVPKESDLEVKIEEETHGKKLDLNSKDEISGTVSFDVSFERTMVFEGGYIFDPLDSVGERNFGLSFKHDREILETYQVKSIKSLTKTTAKKIYKEKYWEPYLISTLTDQNTADLIFDTLVCCGEEWGKKIIIKSIKDNYGLEAPDTTTWEQYMKVVKFAEGPKYTGELLESRIRYHRTYISTYPDALRYYDFWLERCDTYRQEIDAVDSSSGSSSKYFEKIFSAIDKWLKIGEPETTEIYKGVHIIYNKSNRVLTFLPPSPYIQPNFTGVLSWGTICQQRIDAKTDWSTDENIFQEQQWKIVSECLERALNQNIVITLPSSGTATSGQFSGNISSFLMWSA